MSDFKVLISDAVDRACVSVFEKRGLTVDYKPGLAPADLLELISNYHALVVRSATKVTAQLLEKATNLKVVGRAGSGVDNVDVEAASQRGVAVLNTPGGNTISAAEHTFALMIALARQIPAAHISMKEQKWERSAFAGVELFGKTLGIVGLGQIGKEVAKRALAFGMNVISFDPVIPASAFDAAGAKQVDFDTLIRESDFVTLHVPLNEETRDLIADPQFEICKKNLRLINVARGGVVNEEALFRAIESNRIAGAALDVYYNEPPADFRFSNFKNVITTPHLGASTIDAQIRVGVQVAEAIAEYFSGKRIPNIVNADRIG